MQKITNCLWFDKEAEEAMNFYVEAFKGSPGKEAQDSEVVSIERYPTGYSEGPLAGMENKVLNGIFKLAGQNFFCLDGGPIFKFNESISLMVECDDQGEIDYFWGKLLAGPDPGQCGWLKDKFGLSWQIIPKNMGDLIKTRPAMDAMMKMKKINIAELKAAGAS